jgi:hypothetical protein
VTAKIACFKPSFVPELDISAIVHADATSWGCSHAYGRLRWVQLEEEKTEILFDQWTTILTIF